MLIAIAFGWLSVFAQEPNEKEGEFSLKEFMPSIGTKAHPKIKKALYRLGDKLNEMLKKMDEIMAADSAKEEETINAWNDAVSLPADAWQEAAAEIKAVRDAGHNSLVRVDLTVWSKQWGTFLDDIKSKGLATITWKRDIDDDVQAMERGLSNDPKKFQEIKKDLLWIDSEIKDSRKKLPQATGKEVQTEIKRFTKIWKLTSNLQSKLVERKKYLEQWFKDADPSNKQEALTNLGVWRDSVAKNEWLGSCPKAVANWYKSCEESFNDYKKKYQEIKTMNEPISKETLMQDIEVFRNATTFSGLLTEIEKFETELHAREDELKTN
jgi:hypothetical protein